MSKTTNSQCKLKLNVEYKLCDKEGRVKPLFQENPLARFLVGKKGWLSPSWVNRWYAVFLTPFLGGWANSRLVSNIITNVGMAGMASRINGADGVAAFTWIAIGTGTVAAAVGDTALGAEITTGGGARANSTVSRVTTTVTNDTAQNQHTYTFTAPFAITESGVLNAGTAGVLSARQVFSAVNVVNGDSLQITWRKRVSG